jgi:ABC-type Fe3+-hydroxamate transport system substrate-binding protein
MYAPGSSIPIVDFEQGMAMSPDIIFILAWNFRDEIVKQCKMYGYTGDFLVPFPNEPYFHNGK